MLGRVTINPLPHIDPWMTILLPALLWFSTGGRFTFGGAKPVPVTPRKYRKYVQGDLIVSAAGVVTNLGIALGCSIVFLALHYVADLAPSLLEVLGSAQRMMMWGMWLNLVLCFFNLMPIPPLDGSHLFYHLLPPQLGLQYRSLNRFGYLPLFAVLFLLHPVRDFFMAPAYWGMSFLRAFVSPYGLTNAWDIFS
jgi:Zn-dependent protease